MTHNVLPNFFAIELDRKMKKTLLKPIVLKIKWHVPNNE